MTVYTSVSCPGERGFRGAYPQIIICVDKTEMAHLFHNNLRSMLTKPNFPHYIFGEYWGANVYSLESLKKIIRWLLIRWLFTFIVPFKIFAEYFIPF